MADDFIAMGESEIEDDQKAFNFLGMFYQMIIKVFIIKHSDLNEDEVERIMFGDLYEPHIRRRGFKGPKLPDLKGVYFVRSGDLVKIGMAISIKKRVNSFKTANPHEITLKGYIESKDPSWDEKKCHEIFSKLRKTGEWFNITDVEIMRFLNRHPSGRWLGTA